MQSSSKLTPMIVGALAVTAIVGAGTYIAITSKPSSTAATVSSKTTQTQLQPSTQNSSSSTNNASNSSDSPASNNSSSSSNASTATYKNGTYTATAQYMVPHGGQNSIKVTVTVTDGEISAVQTSHDYQDRESGYYIDSFDADIKAAMAGTNISDAYAARVGGASLTSSAFNDALQTIENEAKA